MSFVFMYSRYRRHLPDMFTTSLSVGRVLYSGAVSPCRSVVPSGVGSTRARQWFSCLSRVLYEFPRSPQARRHPACGQSHPQAPAYAAIHAHSHTPTHAGTHVRRHPRPKAPTHAGTHACKHPHTQTPMTVSTTVSILDRRQLTTASTHDRRNPRMQALSTASTHDCRHPRLQAPITAGTHDLKHL